MFALLALAGDLGCSAGPSLVGFVSDAADGNLKAGLLAAICFPVLLLCGLAVYKQMARNVGRGLKWSALHIGELQRKHNQNH